MVELSVSMVVLLVAVGGFSSAILSSMRLVSSNGETSRSLDVAREVMERLRSVPFEEVFYEFNADRADDPDGAGTAMGDTFMFSVYEEVEEDTDAIDRARDEVARGQMVAQVIFPTVPGAEAILREDQQSDVLGTPMDLNADGMIDANDHSADYIILPVVIQIRWQGALGQRTTTLQAVLRNE